MSTDAYYYTDKVKELLKTHNRIKEVSLEFSKIVDNAERIKFCENLMKEFNLLDNYGKLKLEKSNKIADLCREKGNKSYSKRQFVDSLIQYNQSLCFAESNETLALAYGNRSAVFFELNLYETCLNNIDLAINHNYPKDKLDKLENRKTLCLEKIAQGADKDELQAIPNGEEFLKLSYKPHEKVPYIGDCLELKKDEIFGRYLVANRKLSPGDVVIIEDAFSKSLQHNHKYEHCLYCLKDNFMNLQPCPLTTSAMFCSAKCRNEALESFYKYESEIFDKLNSICTKILRVALRTFFEALKVCGGNIEDLKSLIMENEQNENETILDFDDPLDKKNVLRAIDSLQSNEEVRGNADRFQRCGIVAVIVDLYFKHTKLSEDLVTEENRDFFRSYIYKQTQISACNYHGIYGAIMKKSDFELDEQFGSGSYPICSLINHSCAPNIVRVSHNNKNYVVINRPVASGEQLFDNYGFHHCLEDKQIRQKQLLGQYMFECQCEACNGNFPLFPNLKSVESRFDIANDIAELRLMNIKHAKKWFKDVCNYLSKNDKYYPCHEISAMQECLLRCFSLFRLSKFQLKLVESE